VTTSYYRGSHGCLLTFNLAKTSSFSGLNYWLGEIRTNAPTRFQTVLVGTGVGDPNADGQLDIAREFARDQQLTLKEINVTNQAQVQDAFNTLIDKIMTNLNKKNLSDEESIRLRTPVMNDRPPKCLC
jgi:GTPase SAR1 family protein